MASSRLISLYSRLLSLHRAGATEADIAARPEAWELLDEAGRAFAALGGDVAEVLEGVHEMVVHRSQTPLLAVRLRDRGCSVPPVRAGYSPSSQSR